MAVLEKSREKTDCRASIGKEINEVPSSILIHGVVC